MKTDAYFSPDRVYRYWLVRIWNDALPLFCTFGVNPSTADERKDAAGSLCAHSAAETSDGGAVMNARKLGVMAHLRRIRLFMRIVWRVDQSESRMSVALAWEVAGIVHGQIPVHIDPIIEAAWRIRGVEDKS